MEQILGPSDNSSCLLCLKPSLLLIVVLVHNAEGGPSLSRLTKPQVIADIINCQTVILIIPYERLCCRDDKHRFTLRVFHDLINTNKKCIMQNGCTDLKMGLL